MKTKILLISICLLQGFFLSAQTWDGSAGTNWNDAANWTPATVPGLTGTVTIPNTANKPVLASNTTIASINMSAGSALNFNGFSLTTNASLDIRGATLSNTSAATDIVITMNGTGSNYLGTNTITDNITLNHGGSGPFYEGYVGGNIYNGNVIFNYGSTGTVYSSYNQKSTFNGNLAVNRTVAGVTYIFNSGFMGVTGNFNYTNNVGGASYINQAGVKSGPIGGTINITASGAGNPAFQMYAITNLTAGGNISIQNSGPIEIEDDTLKVTLLSITGITGAGSDYLRRNSITGNLTFSDIASNGGSIYLDGNLVNGNTAYTLSSPIPSYEGYVNGCIYNGNTSFAVTGTGTLYTCYNQKSAFNGNLSFNRTLAGSTYIFNGGFTGVTGNFSYTNNAGGASYINQSGVRSGPVGGTVNINASGAGNPLFQMYAITNLTAGGTISIQNSGPIEIEDDTLKVVSLSITGLTGAGSDYLRRNSITGNLTFSDIASNGGSIYLDGNLVNGNTAYTFSSPIPSYEGYVRGCTYNGNTSFTVTGTGTVYTCYNQKSSFNGNLLVNRSGTGATYIFNSGFAGVSGNFSYTNNAGGASYINQSGVASGPVAGTLNILCNGSGNPIFQLHRVTNLLPGGAISLQNSGPIEIEDDTLKVTGVSIIGTTGSGSDYIRRNRVDGNLAFSDVAGNLGSVYLDGNIINGTTVYTANAAISWYESYVGSCTYNGNVTFNRTAGTISTAYNDTTYVNHDLIWSSAAGIDVNSAIEFGGNTNAVFDQLGIQPLTMPRLIMKKTGGGNLTFNDSVTVTASATFTSGNIYTSAGRNLIFPNNISHTGASAASHVVGPVTKIGDDAFTFPVGGPITLNEIRMSAPVGATSRFRAEYIQQNPTINGYNTAAKAGTFGAARISNAGYWDVQRLTGTTNVTLTLGFGTNPYEQYPVLGNLKVAHWNGSQWDDHGNGGTTGTSASGTVVNNIPITSFSPVALAGGISSYFFSFAQPGPGPDGTPLKLKGIGGWPSYSVKQLPAGSYTADSIFLVANGSTTSFRLKDFYGVEKDTTITVAAAPANYIAANGNGSVNFQGWRHFVYLRDGSNNIMGAIKDNNFTLGNTSMNTYFSTPTVATSPNGNVYLKRSFRIQSQFAPAGTKQVRLYITKTELANLQAADPASFPAGINSLTVTKYTGPQEDSLFNPIPGGNTVIIPNQDITIADLGTMYSLEINVAGFSGFYIGGNNINLNLCSGATISLPSNISGASYQWQADNGSGYVNISNGAVYSGVTTSTLTLTNIPGSLHGYKLRCAVNGNTFSQVYTLKFTVQWQGTVSNVWENPANWSCGVLPDANTDVILNAGKANFPQVGSNAIIRSLKVAPGATITVKTGFNLTISK